jgi:hypothetical protein
LTTPAASACAFCFNSSRSRPASDRVCETIDSACTRASARIFRDSTFKALQLLLSPAAHRRATS